MSIVICQECRAVMKAHRTLKEWMRCYSCSFCCKKTDQTLHKEDSVAMAQKKITYISVLDYLGSNSLSDLSKEHLGNVNSLIPAVNDVLNKFGEGRKITSGYRSMDDHIRIYDDINKKRKAKSLPELKIPTGSAHLAGLAVDLQDSDGKLDQWCLDNIDWLTEKGLYIEHPTATVGWCHIQLRKPKSGNNPFHP